MLLVVKVTLLLQGTWSRTRTLFEIYFMSLVKVTLKITLYDLSITMKSGCRGTTTTNWQWMTNRSWWDILNRK